MQKTTFLMHSFSVTKKTWPSPKQSYSPDARQIQKDLIIQSQTEAADASVSSVEMKRHTTFR